MTLSDDDTRPTGGSEIRGATEINGRPATAVRYAMRWEGDRPQGIDLTFKLGQRTVARLALDDEKLIDRAIGRTNHDRLTERVGAGEDKGTLRNEDLVHHRGEGEEVAARTRRTQTRKAEQAETNAVEPDDSAAREAVSRAAQHRKRERLAREGATDNATTSEAATSTPSRKKPEPTQTDAIDAEQRRRDQVLAEVREQFRVVGDRYRFKDGAQGLAFTDRGTRLATATNDARAARAIAAMADAKGWQSIKVSGHDDFRREVWLEARSRGLDVRGYTPTEQDQEEAEKRAAGRLPNAAERVTDKPEASADTQAATGRTSATSGRVERPSTTSIEAEAKGSADRPARTVAGTLVEHGAAPYRHDPEERQSYRASVDTGRGEREVWGVDLERAIDESGAQPGDKVQLERVDSKPVTVEANRRVDGRVVGTEQIAATRHGWDVRVVEQRQVLEAVSDAFAERHARTPEGRAAIQTSIRRSIDERAEAGTLPSVPVYDHTAPSRATQRGARTADTDRTTERAR